MRRNKLSDAAQRAHIFCVFDQTFDHETRASTQKCTECKLTHTYSYKKHEQKYFMLILFSSVFAPAPLFELLK